MREPGTRVTAISHTDAKHNKAYIFGHGVYVGDEDCPVLGVFGKGQYLKNPKIVLDNGKVVWGCQCWWAPVDVVAKRLNGWDVTEIDIDDHIKKHQKAEANGKG